MSPHTLLFEGCGLEVRVTKFVTRRLCFHMMNTRCHHTLKNPPWNANSIDRVGDKSYISSAANIEKKRPPCIELHHLTVMEMSIPTGSSTANTQLAGKRAPFGVLGPLNSSHAQRLRHFCQIILRCVVFFLRVLEDSICAIVGHCWLNCFMLPNTLQVRSMVRRAEHIKVASNKSR